MKRIISLLLVTFMLLSFVSCTNNRVNDETNKNSSYEIDLEQCEIGYELPVYPGCDFKFKSKDGEIFEISNFKVIFTEKNSVITDEPIDAAFMTNRYMVAVTFDGKTDPEFAGKKIYFALLTNAEMSGSCYISSDTVVGDDGTFTFEGTHNTNRYITEFTFGKIGFSY